MKICIVVKKVKKHTDYF